MARSRMIRPEFWSDEKLARIGRNSRLTFIGLWTCSDDYGTTKGHAAWLKSQIFPYDQDLKLRDFEIWLQELESIGVVVPFTSGGEKFYYIKNFKKHQTVDKPSKARNPEPPAEVLMDKSPNTRESSASLPREGIDETETETEIQTETEMETETNANLFQQFWNIYPKKKSKGQAEMAFEKIKPNKHLVDIMVSKIEQAKKSEDWIKEKGKYIPHPSTWLNAKRWEDEETAAHPLAGKVSDMTLRNMENAKRWRDKHEGQS